MLGIKSVSLLLFLLFAYVNGFPMGRCYVSQCDASPYNIKWSSVTIDKNSDMIACLDITKKNCFDPSKYNCCDLFTNYLEKFDISTDPICKGTVAKVTVNNVTKGGGVYFDIYGDQKDRAQLRITALRMDGQDVAGTRVCITVKSPCNDMKTFCRDIDGNCKFALFNPDGHTCCPTCPLVFTNDTNPNTPTSTNQTNNTQPPHPNPNPPARPVCGDGKCEPPTETYTDCPSDCPKPLPVCGDEKCEPPTETYANCPSDCPKPLQPPTPQPPTNTNNPICGDGKCELPETIRLCPRDCNPICGNGVCEITEDRTRCRLDCK